MQEAKQGELREDAAGGNGGAQGDLLMGQAGDERLYDGHSLGIGAGSKIEKGAVYPEPLEIWRQLITSGEPCGPLIITQVFSGRACEAAHPDKEASCTRHISRR